MSIQHRSMLTVNHERLLEDLSALSHIGRTRSGGVSRPALSPADRDGRAWFRQRVEAAGLAFRQDGAGNLSAVLPAADPQAPTLIAGSHLDTVPDGGRFDGALGVLSALEALRTIHEHGLRLPVHLEAISFTDEEGTILGLLGSLAASGQLTEADLARPRGGPDALAKGMERIGINRESILAARREPGQVAGYVELHIEQGTRLESANVEIGIVTAIVGIRSAWLHFQGQAAHAGTMPMAQRRDALWGAAAFVQRARDLVQEQFAPGVCNCGKLQLHPGAFNIVPGTVKLALEFRHGSEPLLDTMTTALMSQARTVADEYGLELQIEMEKPVQAAAMDATLGEQIAAATTRLGLSAMPLLSFAGHDAQAMARIAPTAMIFVPSVGGVSHNPEEFTRPEDVANGANVLLQTLLLNAGKS